MINDLLQNRMDISMLIISKSLKKKEDYKVTALPHLILAEKMYKRDPGTAPRTGDRVP